MKKSNNDPLVEYTYHDRRDYCNAERNREEALKIIFGLILAMAGVAGGYFVGWLAIWIWRMM